MNTMSHPGFSDCGLIISLNSLFTRLRCTALPTFFVTEKPYRLRLEPLGLAFITSKLPAQTLPCR